MCRRHFLFQKERLALGFSERLVVGLNPGDRLLLFTDGITEASGPNGEEFGKRNSPRLRKPTVEVPHQSWTAGCWCKWVAPVWRHGHAFFLRGTGSDLFRLAIGKTLPPDVIDSTGIGSEIHPFAIVRPRRDLGTSASFFDPRIAMTIYVAIPAYFALVGMSGNRGAAPPAE
jgi:hypothetical protein